AARPDEARAPLVAPAVAAREHALAVKQAARRRALAIKRAAAARLRLLRQLELAGIAARRVGPPETTRPRAKPLPRFTVPPSDRAIALATYVQAVGADTILR